MSDILARMLALHSSPAICGIKASNLISFDTNEISDIEEEIKELNSLYGPKICFKILQHRQNKVLVLVYKKNVMEKTLLLKKNKDFLESLGYDVKDAESMIGCLKDRLNQNNDFPHEIGVFLGYDLNDTIEFLHGNKNCLYVGYWKVYSDLDEKMALFNRYNKCRDCVVRLLDKGYPLENFLR
ncbi:MAG: DUF3793 family protein [Acholeplasmatales bacterium]|nr:DUF3793 family protein [Acholeplasmatales bacterium]